ncbi:uncharacterized protein LOC115959193 [Quercus lobata]|uniref:uncharacterized protein LOC115959193 n=1 Tax=Quercus lobata TaxID=97700 RepID=UPI001247BD46|nr:uncharacterized protein LOC115959193 [Quercus lobata]XP_030933369.1 uncharacterized protein LOC115959193 [Quercus lobata]XP_030933370.1 uncharacterized protein LOC115959193 [Quercus lobata]
MVSLRRRKLLGLCSGKSSFIAPLPRFFNGITPEISTHNSNHVRVHPVAPANVNQPVGNRIGPGSSNGSGSSSSKEQPIQPVAGLPTSKFKLREQSEMRRSKIQRGK